MTPTRPRLTLGHVTLAARDLDRLEAFYVEVLGFVVTDRGEPVPGAGQMAFLSQDPAAHHQIVLVATDDPPARGFPLADHLAFRVDDLDGLRAIGERLAEADVDVVIPVSHGNAWSLYFTDPEGNGLECFVDTPLHVAQPYAGPLDLGADDAAVVAATRAEVAARPGTQPVEDWRAGLVERLAAVGVG